jgi:hypothetical protein
MSRDPQLRRSRRHVTATLAALVAAASLSACTEVEKAEKEHYSPAKLTAVKGEKDLYAVTLTQEGADRIGIATEQVGTHKGHTFIPYAALMYESDGSAFVYTNTEGLTYVRAHVDVDRVSGDRVLLREGPPVETKVVTTGAAQVHGAELEYGEY